MVRNILFVVLAVAVCVGGYLLWKQYYGPPELGSGTVSVRKAPSDSVDTAANPDDGGAPTPSRSDAPGTINGDAVGTQPGAAGAAQTSTSTGAGNQLTTPGTVAPQTSMMRAPDTTVGMGSTPASLPVSDTIQPNPPNGTLFGGTGAFQWYRQGNITWRVNSKSGSSCIAFATMEEWQKAIVMSHGCGRSA